MNKNKNKSTVKYVAFNQMDADSNPTDFVKFFNGTAKTITIIGDEKDGYVFLRYVASKKYNYIYDFVYKNNILYTVENTYPKNSYINGFEECIQKNKINEKVITDIDSITAIVLNNKLVIRGDSGSSFVRANVLSGTEFAKNFSSISLTTIATMLYGVKESGSKEQIKNIHRVADELISGKINLLDITKDVTKPLTKSEKVILNRCNKNNINYDGKIPTGFTLLPHSKKWHMSSSVLIEKNNKRYIFGQDEGTYFGCELRGTPNTVKDAFINLIPEQAFGKRYKRQGEWFAVPAKPPTSECLELSLTVGLPKDDELSNNHIVNDAKEIRVDLKRKLIYANGGSLEHDQHNPLIFSGWNCFYKNTALRSVSEEGVD